MVALLLLAAACGRPRLPAPRLVGDGPFAFDAMVAVEFGVPLDPTTLTARSLLVEDGHGSPVAHEARLRGSRVEVALVVDAACVDDPPERLVLTWLGAPSIHGWRSAAGALLESTHTLELELRSTASPEGPRPPRLVSVAGAPLGGEGPRAFGPELELVFEGRLDPETLIPSSFPLFPDGQGLELPPVIPGLTWTAVGSRTTVHLSPGGAVGRLELRTRALGVRDRSGRAPEPLVRLALLRTD